MAVKIKQTKVALLTQPETKNNGVFTNNTYVDTEGYDHLRVLIAVGVTDTTFGSTGATTAPFIEECDTYDGSYTAVAGASLAAAIAATDDGKLFCIDVNLNKAHKKFMRLNAPTAGTGTGGFSLCVIGILSDKFSGDLPDAAEFAALIEA